MGTLSILALSLFFSSSLSSLNAPQETPTAYPLPISLHQISVTENKLITVKTPPTSYSLPEAAFVSQSYNNCGPAALSMVFSTYGKSVSQEELAEDMRPYHNDDGSDDDKSIFPQEFVNEAKKYGFEAIHRPNGSVAILKEFVANDIPVVIRTWLNPDEDIGHFRIIRGYDDKNQVFIQDDSYYGPNLPYSYSEISALWQPFNYGYIVVYPKEKQAVVTEILGDEKEEKVAWQNALSRAEREKEMHPENPYADFNKSIAYYHLGEYKQSISAYENAQEKLPERILWYQLEPLGAYQKVGNYSKLFELSDAIIDNGNPAFSELYLMRGESYLERGDKETARVEFEKAVNYNSKSTAAQKALEKI